MAPLEVLKQYWGYEAFREPQAAIVDAVLEGKDTLALLPTGGGKSICFQVPGLCQAGMTLVISPLIAAAATITGDISTVRPVGEP